jgi:hypothetical protein
MLVPVLVGGKLATTSTHKLYQFFGVGTLKREKDDTKRGILNEKLKELAGSSTYVLVCTCTGTQCCGTGMIKTGSYFSGRFGSESGSGCYPLNQAS